MVKTNYTNVSVKNTLIIKIYKLFFNCVTEYRIRSIITARH